MDRLDAPELEAIHRILETWNLGPEDRVLEIGCGSGRLSELVAPRVGDRGLLVGVDISIGMLRRALPRAKAMGFLLTAATAPRLPLRDAMIRTVLCFQVLPHLADGPGAMAEIARVLEPRGTLWIVHLASRTEINALHARLGPPVDRHRIPHAAAIRGLLERSRFDVLRLEEGPPHYLVEARRRDR